MPISQMMHKSTVRIECDVGNGLSVGTGFWFSFLVDDQRSVPLLVTNKHVVQGATQTRIRINVSHQDNQSIRFYDVVIPNGESDFILHPDPNIDICILPVANFFNQLETQGFTPDIFSFTDRNFLSTNFITPIEEVYMTGYPNGLWDMVNNRPITRKGITASSPFDDWQGNPEFLIDMACFGGSSGSPVYIMNQGSFATENGLAMGERLIFLGLLYAGPMVNVNGSIEIINVPTAATAVVRSSIGMNLGLVIKAEKLNDLRPLLGI
ncbi:S1 family peptidase [Citrobacter youngae]|uniref:S1 family peptidase n=1 Tax=Citrobacter youngae TaxID=133448 RepID=UPI00397D3000